jgi:NADP-dependent 3-hydroxy acid dehydrogenase YdfG
MDVEQEPDDTPVVWVVGAGSGMGRAAALAIAESGRRVVLSGRRYEPLESLATAAAMADHAALVLQLDVGDAAAVEQAHSEIQEQWGRLDALVIASGVNVPQRSWADLTVREVEQVVDTNLLGVARVVGAALPSRFSPGSGVAYGASKTALGALCASLNHDEAANGVRACHLCPGDVNTDFLEHRPTVPDAAARAAMLQPEDVARAVRFVLDSPPHVRIDELVLTPAPAPGR